MVAWHGRVGLLLRREGVRRDGGMVLGLWCYNDIYEARVTVRKL